MTRPDKEHRKHKGLYTQRVINKQDTAGKNQPNDKGKQEPSRTN